MAAHVADLRKPIFFGGVNLNGRRECPIPCVACDVGDDNLHLSVDDVSRNDHDTVLYRATINRWQRGVIDVALAGRF
jgi:hypothetical protein